MKLKPGDIIVWQYNFGFANSAHKGERLWSSMMREWVPVGGPALLVSIDNETLMWLSPWGLFHALRKDHSAYKTLDDLICVVLQDHER